VNSRFPVAWNALYQPSRGLPDNLEIFIERKWVVPDIE
jgi:hypothetical protein